ncbi:uncharacterized protein LOC119723965 [Patiria miniata]|uniref:DUF7041 domain-containing protein n=1 Tax=Patiria miniata TaxID=46514 RepID=A0A913ZIE6_PATMI|nr:uncharacterized protein LOC119723965 [Patiria miniata]
MSTEKGESSKTVDQSDMPEDKPQIGALSIKLPPFWPADPLIWFAQAEAQFHTRGIKREDTKFAHILAAVQPEIIQEVRDLVITPPKKNPYQKLKEEMIKRTSASEQKRLQMLLTEEELGDKKPSQLLRRMRQLLGEHKLEEGIFKQLFLQRLPSNAQLVLASSRDSVSLEQLAALAERILEVYVPPVNVVTTPAPSSSGELAELRDQISKLTMQVSSMQAQLKRQSHSRSQSRTHPRSASRDQASTPSDTANTQTLCWYHRRFGAEAHKCVQPCSYTTQQGNDPTRG